MRTSNGECGRREKYGEIKRNWIYFKKYCFYLVSISCMLDYGRAL